MPDIWGQLPKAQDNNQTIDQAIALAIANHEADADAHLGVGESLQSHKASEVIDHVAQSIVGDKITAKQEFLNIPLTVDFWPTHVGINTWFMDQVSLRATFGGVAIAELKSREAAGVFYSLLGPNGTVFQFSLYLGGSANMKFDILCGWVDDWPSNQAIGFHWESNHLYARWQNFGDGDIDIQIDGVDITQQHIMRVQFDYDTKILTWFVDGVAKATHTLTAIPSWSSSWVYVRFQKLVSGSQTLWFGQPFLAN
jgi:hypothetical protein